ncbi:hypothetical protein J2S55_000043 [Streptosporangium brasiliense]|uniref:Uncharacterized protein n=1 Tax=Streptosporangium brasiliense TaxID=47480 RepID=A0ABT9QUV6_9ACTN|nr:hypothetical protein [Streptosporangium brasiliense]
MSGGVPGAPGVTAGGGRAVMWWTVRTRSGE